MPEMRIAANVKGVLAGLSELERKQAPFALRWTLNAIAKDIEQATKNTIQQRFRTSPQGLRFLQRHVLRLFPGSKYFKLHAGGAAARGVRTVVGVIPPGGKGQLAGWSRYRGSLLPAMEAGGPTPGPRDFGGRIGLGRYAIPVVRQDARPRMPNSMFPINLKLQARQGISGSLEQGALRGLRRTYMVPMLNARGHAMIFQRYGRRGQRGADDSTMPIFWTQNETRLPARRFFFPTAMRIASTRFDMHFKAAMQQALFGRGSYRT